MIEEELSSISDLFFIEDSMFASAYEDSSDLERSEVKNILAKLYSLFGVSKGKVIERLEYSQGFYVTKESFAAPFAIVLVDKNYSNYSGLLSSILPMLLSGIENCIVYFTFSSSGSLDDKIDYDLSCISKKLLLGLELLGSNMVYYGSEQTAEGVLSLLHKKLGMGRLIVLGEKPFAWSCLSYAAANCIPFLTLFEKNINNQLIEHGQHAYLGKGDDSLGSLKFWPQLEPSWGMQKICKVGSLDT